MLPNYKSKSDSKKVVIVVDSAASLPKTDLSNLVKIVPMQLMIGSKTFKDGIDISSDDFYRILSNTNPVPSTAAPSPSSYLDAFRLASKVSNKVLCITVSSNFSSSYKSAENAIAIAKIELPGIDIKLIDSESAAGSEGLVVLEAVKAASMGDPIDKVYSAALKVIERVYLLAYLDTLYYVWKSGRIPRIAYAGAALLKIKPMLQMFRGDVTNVAKPRTRKKANEIMLSLMRNHIGNNPANICVMHGNDIDNARLLVQQIENNFDCRELYISEFTAAMGVHTGPGLVGISYWTD